MTLKELVNEKLRLRNLEQQTQHHICHFQRYGYHQLLQDLYTVNEQVGKVGTTQPSLPHPSAIPPSHHIFISDIKDCYFFRSHWH